MDKSIVDLESTKHLQSKLPVNGLINLKNKEAMIEAHQPLNIIGQTQVLKCLPI